MREYRVIRLCGETLDEEALIHIDHDDRIIWISSAATERQVEFLLPLAMELTLSR